MSNNPFYTVGYNAKINALKELKGTRVNPRELMADIADGCGGCEHMMVTMPSGNEGWVSVLHDEGRYVYYCLVEIEPTPDQFHAHECIKVRWMRWNGTGSTDSMDRYVRFVYMVLNDN